MKKMTNKEYCNTNGSLCPYCRSTNIDIIYPFETQDNITWQPVKCNNCGKRWTDIHSLVGYEEDGEV